MSENTDKTFTQDEVNAIVSKRLNEEKAKLDAALAEKETELQAKELRLVAWEKLQEKGLPAELLDALNTSSPEAFAKSLEIIEQKISTAPSSTTAKVSTGGEHNPDSGGAESSIRAAMGLNGG